MNPSLETAKLLVIESGSIKPILNRGISCEIDRYWNYQGDSWEI